MGSATPSLIVINKEIIRTGPMLSQQTAVTLCQSVSDEEIYAGLKSIDDDKAPGVDGYNTLFYNKT